MTLTHDISRKESTQTLTMREVSRLFEKCHDEIWEGGKNDPAFAFTEFSKILIVKILDETTNHPKHSIFTNPKKIKSFYSKSVRKINKNVFEPRINLSDMVIGNIIGLIKHIRVSEIDLDVKGQALEIFLGKTFRGEYGQFFTPRPVVDFCVSAIDPQENDIIMDPCCGSGGFLIHSLIYLKKKSTFRPSEQLFGNEINGMIATIAMMDMLVYEDGSSNITRVNSLSDEAKNEYTLVLTNPPFGNEVTEESILTKYALTKFKKSEILFIEKCHNLLCENGRMCIVLPDSILSNKGLSFVRQFILDNFQIMGMVSLPQHTFSHSDAGVKSSLLFLKKRKTEKDYKIFIGIANHIGYDSRQNEDLNELPQILKNWQTKKESANSFFINRSELGDNFLSAKFKTQTGRRLNDVCHIVFTGKTPARKDYMESGSKILKVRDLTGSGIKWNVDEYGYVDKRYKNKNQIQKDDILIISSAHHPKYIGLKVDIVNYIPKDFDIVYCVTEIMVIRPDSTKIDPYELLCILKSSDGYNAIQSCIRGQTSHIYPHDISFITLPKRTFDKNNILKFKKMLFDKTKLEWNIHQKQQELIGKF